MAAPGDLHASADASNLAQLAESRNVLDAWRDYVLLDLTPSFSWAEHPSGSFSAPSLFNRGNAHLAQPPSHFLGTPTNPPPVQVAFVKSKVSDTPVFLSSDADSLLQEYTPGLQRYVIAPSLTQPWGDHSALRFSAIFAYQRFAGLGVDSVSMQDSISPATPYSYRENSGSYGTGMRVDFNSTLSEQMSWQIGFQSRVNMDAFNNYRGVYSEPGSFDIPASANVGLGYALSQDFKLDLDVERVMYSQIAPFTSNALPTRFLVLLGSSISPAFTWQDLDVYSLGATWRDPSDGIWSLRYSSREQPLPTSRLLQNALTPYLSDHDVEFAFARMFGKSSLHLAATYAPTQFVLGLPTSNSLRNGNGNTLEYELLWVTRF